MINKLSAFLLRGNVLDLAVGVIIAGAFGKIIDALVTNIIMPVIGIFTGGIDFSKAAIKIGEASIGWGAMVQAIIDFLIIGTVLFLLVSASEKMKKKEAEAPAPPPANEVLLAEIKALMEGVEKNTRR